MKTLERSADVARFRLGLGTAPPIITGPTDPIVRRQRYEARRDLWERHGERLPLEVWRPPCRRTRR